MAGPVAVHVGTDAGLIVPDLAVLAPKPLRLVSVDKPWNALVGQATMQVEEQIPSGLTIGKI
jgi:hypothetical protein